MMARDFSLLGDTGDSADCCRQPARYVADAVSVGTVLPQIVG